MGPLVNGSCFITLVAMLGVFGYELHKCYVLTGGPGAMWYESVSLPKSQIGWAWLEAVTVFYGAVSPNCTNMSDYSRFSKNAKQMYCGIILSIAMTGTLIPMMGMVTASNTLENYGTAMWLPTDVCLQWMMDDYSSGTRAAAFLWFSFCFLTAYFQCFSQRLCWWNGYVRHFPKIYQYFQRSCSNCTHLVGVSTMEFLQHGISFQ